MTLTDPIYFNDIETIKKILKKYQLLQNSDFYRKEVKRNYRVTNNDLLSHYQDIIKNNDYHFILKDNSILIFERNGTLNTLRYSFIEFPIKFESYEEFLDSSGLSVEEQGYSRIEEYHQLLSESDLKKFPNYLRYDYSENEYSELCHSVSHIHIGVSNNIRIPISKKLTPLAFVLIIIKYMYYTDWKLIVEEEEIQSILKNIKANCPELECSLFSNEDKKEFYLH